jgi:hypothetical protein
MEGEWSGAVKTLTADMSLIASQAVEPGRPFCADERDWLTLTASPLGVTPSITSMAPSGIVTRTVIGMASAAPDSTSATFSGRTETVTAVPRRRCADLASLISGPASSLTRSASSIVPRRKLACPMKLLTNRLAGRS